MDKDYIRCGDCLVLMQEIPDKSIDMILCDLPYGKTENKWDLPLDLEELWKQYKRIIKDNGAILLFSQMPFTADLVKSNEKIFRYEWIWQKGRATGFMNSKKMPLKAHENILVFYKKLPTYNPQMREGFGRYAKIQRTKSSNYERFKMCRTESDGKRYPIDVIQFHSVKNNDILHPTQKPIALLEYLIKTYTNTGEIVLDNCMGSGSTIIAAINTNRHYIGIEINEQYYCIAKKRIENSFAK